MKGVKPEDVKKIEERNEFMRDLFRRDCIARTKAHFKDKDGYFIEPLSGPKAQRAFKKRFRVVMNSQRMFKLRAEVFEQCGLDDKGRPKKAALRAVAELSAGNGTMQQAARDPNSPLFNVAVVPTESEEQGKFLRNALAVLAEKGLVPSELKVDDVHQHYATVSRFTT